MHHLARHLACIRGKSRVWYPEIHQNALQVGGLHTNQAFLKRIARHPAFIACQLDTSFIKAHEASLTGVQAPAPEVIALAAVAKHQLAVQKVGLQMSWLQLFGGLCASSCRQAPVGSPKGRLADDLLMDGRPEVIALAAVARPQVAV